MAEHDLQRFLTAQADDYRFALAELRGGRKESHWIWYIFPQAKGLGRSPVAMDYAIQSTAEAKAYLRHPILGPRLAECATTLLAHRGRPIETIMDFPDNLKLRSSMTLFAALAESPGPWQDVLDAFFDGETDQATLEFLAGNSES